MTHGDWATPGTAVAQPQVASIPAGDQAMPAGPRMAGTHRPPRPLPMRPQTVLEVLDGGFAIVRARPGLLLGLSAMFIVPLSVLSAFLRRDATRASGSELLEDPWLLNSTAPGDGWGPFLVGMLGRSLVQTIVAFAVGRLVSAWYSDREADLTEVLRWIARRAHVIVAAWVLTHLLQTLGLAGVGLGALVVAVFTTVVAPVVAIEQVGPVAAIRRSFTLVRGRFGPVLFFFGLSGVLAELLGLVLGLLPSLLGYLLAFGAGWVLVAIGSVIAGVVSTTFLAAATVALYLDIRVRREGIDLQLLIPDLFETDPRPMIPDDELPLPEHDPDEVREAADRILGSSELDDGRNIIERFADWLVDFLGDLFGGLSGAGEGLGAFGVIVQLLLLALAVTVLGLAVRALLRARRSRLGVENGGMSVVFGVPGDPDELGRLSDAAEAAGEWKAAVLGRYRLIVASLVADGVLADVPGRTTGEYQREFADVRPGQSSTFGAATRAFEAAYFGDVAVGPGDVDDMRARASTLLVDRVVTGASR